MAVTDTTGLLDDVMIDPVTGEIIDQKDLAERLLAQAKEQGVSLVGPGGLLNQLTKKVLETALEAELTEHLGHEHGGVPMAANMRNGTRSKTVLTEIGPVEIGVPRDREGSFEPVIVPKRKRRLDGIDQIVLSLSARGLTTGEIAAHFDEVYGAKASKDTISRIMEKIAGELAEWSARPLDALYPVIFVDAIAVKVRDGGRSATLRSTSSWASPRPGRGRSWGSGPETAPRAHRFGRWLPGMAWDEQRFGQRCRRRNRHRGRRQCECRLGWRSSRPRSTRCCSRTWVRR